MRAARKIAREGYTEEAIFDGLARFLETREAKPQDTKHVLQHHTAFRSRSTRAFQVKNLFLLFVFFVGPLAAAHAEDPPVYTYDQYGRLTSCPAMYEGACTGKREVACPAQSARTGVILAIGQSQAANTGAKRVVTQFPDKVVNYFGGKCFVASSPLLGASAPEGEFITMLADDLIKSGTYQSVVILAAAIHGTEIARWRAGGDLNGMLLQWLSTVKGRYRITDIVWHQGESDFGQGKDPQAYVADFNSMLGSLRGIGVNAPIFIGVTTYCGTQMPWTADNPISLAQRQLADSSRKIYVGANSDQLLTKADRREDACHFAESGQRKVAAAYAAAITRVQRTAK